MESTAAGLLCMVLATSVSQSNEDSPETIKAGYVNSKNILERRSATNHLVNRTDGWYLEGLRGGVLRKVIGQGRIDSRGTYRAVTDNMQGHVFHHPPRDFIKYLLSLPVMYDKKRIKNNGTHFLVRPVDTSAWRQIMLEGIQNEDSALHMFDQHGHWYRFPNGSELREYLAKLPKVMAACDNYLCERVGDEWGVRKQGGFYRPLVHSGELIANLRCDNGIWFTVRNPPNTFLKFLLELNQDVFDPYNLTQSEYPTALPFGPTQCNHTQST